MEISIRNNRFKGKYVRARKFVNERFLKRTKNVALHVQSRSENEYDHSEFCMPNETLNRREQTWLRHRDAKYMVYLEKQRIEELEVKALQEEFPLGAGW